MKEVLRSSTGSCCHLGLELLKQHLCVSCCIQAEQVSGNLLQDILFETFRVAGAHFSLVCSMRMHILLVKRCRSFICDWNTAHKLLI